MSRHEVIQLARRHAAHAGEAIGRARVYTDRNAPLRLIDATIAVAEAQLASYFLAASQDEPHELWCYEARSPYLGCICGTRPAPFGSVDADALASALHYGGAAQRDTR